MQYVALLRGINVGGKNLVRMADLRRCFEAHGFTDVATYIQSGNVLFRAPKRRSLADEIEQALAATFDCGAPVVVRSHEQLRAVLARAPDWFGAAPSAHRYDCIFLKEPLTAAKAVKSVPVREGVDLVAAGPGVLYFSRVAAKAAQSRLSRIAALPVYQRMTIRNLNTTRKLLEIMDARAT